MLSTIAVTVNEKYIDNASLGEDILDGVFVKPNYKNPKIALYRDLLDMRTQTLYDLPRTSIKYDTFDVAPFTERSTTKKPFFKEEWKKWLWDWANGTTIKELPVSRVHFQRVKKKFIKQMLERDVTK
jgi:hypothetical protein